MDYSFNIDLAKIYGVEEAVLLNHLYYWIQHNAANGKHLHDGRHWTYNSAQAFTEIFPFWNRKKIDRLIQNLKDKNALIIGNYNESGQDRTRWFALPESVLSIVQNRPMHCPDMSNALPENVQPLPNSNPYINPDGKPHTVDEAIGYFLEHRKKLRKPMTEHAVVLLRARLESLAPGNDQKKIELIENAIYRGWQGIFAIEPDGKKPEPKKQEESNADRYAITEGFKTSF